MYLKRIKYRNVGPLKNLMVEPVIEENKPKPLIIVGENGSGKTTFLSNIIDSLYEMAGMAFSNVRKANDDSNNGYQYYKAISPHQITIGEKYLYSHIIFADEKEIEYIFKSGKIDENVFKNECNPINRDKIKWKNETNIKEIYANKEDIEKIFSKDVICYFAPNRYEKPVWMGNKYFEIAEAEHLNINEIWNGRLLNSISAEAVTEANIRWLLDVIVDSRPNVIIRDESISLDGTNRNDLYLLSQARHNLEKIMSNIIGCDIKFELNYRNRGADRFKIVRKDNSLTISPTLNSLSTGQLALFNLFATIVRYADTNDINNSINLNEITGIVLIDEVELHLHSSLQIDILPKLIKLFPKIQFVITTHSPLFVMGMEREFSENGFDMYELPNADKISVDRFSEFNKAYSYYQETARFEKDMRNAINEKKKTLVITEGTTDWKHMKTAFNSLSSLSENQEIFENLDFEFLEYEPANSDSNATYKFEMGGESLCNMCESYAKLPNTRKLIFVADRDVENVNKRLMEDGKLYKNWGNNVYSFTLPIPDFRKDTPKICIEHLYTDEEIKTEFLENGVPRRLYIGNEFDERGISFDTNRYCLNRNICGPNSISIIEGSSKERVTGLKTDKNINFGLSKMKFAENIVNGVSGFTNFNFKEFLPIFEIIKSICNENEEER